MPELQNSAAPVCCQCAFPNCGNRPVNTAKKKLLTRAMENFYDNCAAYNIRYIPYRTETKRRGDLQCVAKDLIVLFCFLATSLIVLLTILSRMVIHMSGVCLQAVQWLKQRQNERAPVQAHEKAPEEAPEKVPEKAPEKAPEKCLPPLGHIVELKSPKRCSSVIPSITPSQIQPFVY